jgi:glycosyl hydrolase family 36
MSSYGRWITDEGLPAFLYDADHTTVDGATYDPVITPPTDRHFVALGNRRIQAVVDNRGGTALWDTAHGLRWITAPDPDGTGYSVIEEADGASWGTAFAERPAGSVPERVFGPTWFRVRNASAGLAVERTINCVDGESPWVLVQVTLALDPSAAPRAVTHVETWALGPRFVNLGGTDASRKDIAVASVTYDVTADDGRIRANEVRTGDAAGMEERRNPSVFGPPLPLVLESIGHAASPRVVDRDGNFPVLTLRTPIELQPGEVTTLWFRFGVDDGAVIDDPAALVATSTDALAGRLPQVTTEHSTTAAREIPWHVALLTGGACVDAVLGDHTLDQASCYSFDVGFNGAGRDPLQHALPLVYSEPDLALSVLRNTSSWCAPTGEMPYALDGRKGSWDWMFRPSDQGLWALWLASEYAAVTGDTAAFAQPLNFHPRNNAEPVSLAENLRRQFRYFVDEVGTGEHGHVRILNADWNDNVLHEFAVERDVMIEKGESVLNSAMAAWVLPVYAGLCDRLGDGDTAAEARRVGADLRAAVAGEWNGKWFKRAYAPGFPAVGDNDMWLEVQPWAILCGAADGARATELLSTLDELVRRDSPLGARLKWPVSDKMTPGVFGEGTGGGIWQSINMTLVWAAARHAPALGWDEWQRSQLAAHEAAYPGEWEGTVSGPDCYNAPESPRAGRTWGMPGISMQHFPVNNLHSHAQPVFSYLRLLGIEPTATGALRVGSGDGSYASRTFARAADGHGRVTAAGPVVIESAHGRVEGSGEVAW